MPFLCRLEWLDVALEEALHLVLPRAVKREILEFARARRVRASLAGRRACGKAMGGARALARESEEGRAMKTRPKRAKKSKRRPTCAPLAFFESLETTPDERPEVVALFARLKESLPALLELCEGTRTETTTSTASTTGRSRSSACRT